MSQIQKKLPLGEQVFRKLQNQILGGNIPVGEYLPPERKLAEQLCVHRGVVREAIKRLEEKGLVQTRHGGGTKVLNFRDSAGLELIPVLISHSDHLNLEIIRSFLEWRGDLMSAISERVALQHDTDSIDALYLIVEEIETSDGHLEELQNLSIQFWDRMAEASKNIAYRLTFNTLKKAYQPMQAELITESAIQLMDVTGYRQLVQAIEKHDVLAAGNLALKIECPLSVLMDSVFEQQHVSVG